MRCSESALDQDPAFYLHADPNPNPDPLIQEVKPCGSGSWFNYKVTKVEFLHEKYGIL